MLPMPEPSEQDDPKTVASTREQAEAMPIAEVTEARSAWPAGAVITMTEGPDRPPDDVDPVVFAQCDAAIRSAWEVVNECRRRLAAITTLLGSKRPPTEAYITMKVETVEHMVGFILQSPEMTDAFARWEAQAYPLPVTGPNEPS